MSIFGRVTLNQHDAAALPDETVLPDLPRDSEGPVFREPWEAQAFAMAVDLHARGHFTWPEWADALSREIKSAGSTDTGDDYYLHWLTALEKLVASKNFTPGDELPARKAPWTRAARARPHGEPSVLVRGG